MTLDEIRAILQAVVLVREQDLQLSVERAYSADLMSDVLAFSDTNSVLITGLTNAQVIRTAEVSDIRAIVFIQNKRPEIETIALANDRKIPLLATGLSMFDTCGRLYEKGLRGRSDGSS
jgi:predicted transcriptional regulator